jgi:hypothetical protein
MRAIARIFFCSFLNGLYSQSVSKRTPGIVTAIPIGPPLGDGSKSIGSSQMLRVITSHTVDILTFKLENRLTGERAEQVRTLVTRSKTEMRLVVDITELMFVDALGEEVLSFLKRFGAHFLAETAYSLDVCERLHLPLEPKQGSGTPSTGPNGNSRPLGH